MDELDIVNHNVGNWVVASVVFRGEDTPLAIPVTAIIGNSVTTSARGERRLNDWKVAVATAAKECRGPLRLDPNWHYCISAGFSFHPGTHGNQSLDVENFLKPSFDALAAGLFCEPNQNPSQIPRYDYDDSNFRYLFVHRLADATHANNEGAGFVVSIRK